MVLDHRVSRAEQNIWTSREVSLLLLCPATTTRDQRTPEEQEQTGVTSEQVRLPVGIEDVRDIIGDLDQALKVSQA